MLKLVAGLVAGATILTAGTVSAMAAPQGSCFGDCQKTRVCDTTSCTAQCYLDEDNDGVCDSWGAGVNCTGSGQNYVDEDNDGVCDNQGTNCNGGGSMSRNCHGNGNGRGHHG